MTNEEGIDEGGNTPSLPTVYDSETAIVTRPQNSRGNVNNLKKLKKHGNRDIVRSRPGGGGPVQYAGWTDAANVLDDAFGLAGWTLQVLKLDEYPHPNPKNAEEVVWTVIAHIRVTASDGTFMEAFGHGDYFSNNPNANKADAIESGVSRALTKCVGRWSEPLRALWAKDSEAIANLQSPTEQSIKNAQLMLGSIKQMNPDGLEQYMTQHGYLKNPDESWDLSNLNASELQELTKDLAPLMVAKKG